MSDDTSLELPFAHRRNPHQTRATDRHLEWLQRHHELAAVVSGSTYTGWDITELASLVYPESSVEDLALAADLMGFYFLFDDQLDGPLGRRPDQVALICERLTAIVHGTRPAGASPAERAFADLWRRSTRGMSPRWTARAAYNWEFYFACHPAEAASRNIGHPPDREGYLTLRRGTAAMETIFDMIERLGRFEVPQHVLHHPLLRQLRQLAADIPSFTNDVRSYAQEAQRGDVANLVMIVQRDRCCSAEEACAVVWDEAQRMADRFCELRDQLPDICRWMALDAAQQQAAQRYADGMALWLAGYLHWESRTRRYHHG
ncbi:terpene synthase family protein [Saccharothrix sp. ST-888]|uniref:terpene synthase family protein n=1 Tax=Saccharothrix sp. ST-888 TaxID=1427391 RepID=UPI0005EC885E|nr:terpene synthase family protein [Saccharothrix sp. ST-888]